MARDAIKWIVEIKKSQSNLGRAGSPPLTAQNNYARRFPKVTMWRSTFTPKLPLSLRRYPPPSNTPIPWPTSLTIPNGIQVQSAVLPQYILQTDSHTYRPTDRWAIGNNSVPTPVYNFGSVSINDVVVRRLSCVFVCLSSQWSRASRSQTPAFVSLLRLEVGLRRSSKRFLMSGFIFKRTLVPQGLRQLSHVNSTAGWYNHALCHVPFLAVNKAISIAISGEYTIEIHDWLLFFFISKP